MSLVLKYPKHGYESNARPRLGRFKTEEMSGIKMINKKNNKKKYTRQ